MLAIFLMLLSPLTPLPIPRAVLERIEAHKAPAPAAAPAAMEKKNFIVTDDTDVRLDGKACKFKDVPPGASIEKLDLAADKCTIIRIDFISKRP